MSSKKVAGYVWSWAGAGRKKLVYGRESGYVVAFPSAEACRKDIGTELRPLEGGE